ncbi:MAG TPA: branched-chain amino acid ABC transporter substrate-binding protein [Candidatus Dormibacteraeota bacterium]|nr:branched-chain amino acid ABC transporter substrate-binding protein [Candidatus Dormibacteraeota bacterium]
MRRWACSSAAALAVACVACGTTTGSQPSAQVLRIGVDLPLTGHEARAAVPALNGIRFFVQTHPTLDGFQVVLVTSDDARAGSPNPSLGVSDVEAFIGDSSVVAMIGPFDAMVARNEIPVANAAGLAMVSPATSNPCLTKDVYIPILLNPARTVITCRDAGLPAASELRPQRNNNFFRLTTTDELQGAAAADYAFEKLHIQRAAVISDHEVYGQGLADAFSARLTNLGGSVLGHIDLEPTKTDATGFLQGMKDAGARAIYYGGTSKGCGIRYQMRALFPTGEQTPFLGGDGIAHDPACVNLAADNSPGIYATVPFVDATTRPAAAAIIRNFKVAHGASADYGPYTLVAYDATAILYAALDHAIRDAGGKRPARAAVTAALAQTSNLAGTTGDLGFDAAGDTTNRVVSIFEATGADPRAAWKLVDRVDYSSRLPY